MNRVEIWFSILTLRRIRRAAFKGVDEMTEDTYKYIEPNNQNPKPFAWAKLANEILAKAKNYKDTSVTRH